MVNDLTKSENADDEKPAVTLPGAVEKILKPIFRHESEKAQIAIRS